MYAGDFWQEGDICSASALLGHTDGENGGGLEKKLGGERNGNWDWASEW